MLIALDIDDTVTAHPIFFRELYRMWLRHGPQRPIFITARPESQRALTLDHLKKLGIKTLSAQLHMFPLEYEWPFPSPEALLEAKKLHSQWKARKCIELGVSVLIDDCSHNVEACRAAGVFVLQVMAPTMKEEAERLQRKQDVWKTSE